MLITSISIKIDENGNILKYGIGVESDQSYLKLLEFQKLFIKIFFFDMK